MIIGYAGLPGAGKSYEVVTGPIAKALSEGRSVLTNIPLKLDAWGDHADKLTVVSGEQLETDWYLEARPGSLVVIDECWEYWPSGTSAAKIPDDIKEWFAKHRHKTDGENTMDIVLVTQDFSAVASYVRNLVQKTHRMTKLVEVGFSNRYRVDVYSGIVTGQRPPKAQLVATWFGRYKKEHFALYESHTQGGDAKENVVDSRGSVLKSWRLWSVLVALIAVPALLSQFSFGDVVPQTEKTGSKLVVQKPTVTVGGPVIQQPAMSVTNVSQPLDDVSSEWTLVGTIERESGDSYAVLRSKLGMRKLPLSECNYQDGLEWICRVDGKKVATWTGSTWRTLAAVDPLAK